MREYILLYINGTKHKIYSKSAKKNLSEYLREELNLKGTKIVCSEGDCGACTVLIHRYNSHTKRFQTINSCIAPLYLLDCCHVITIEGVKEKNLIHPVQSAIAKYHGTQCGFCTSGIVNSLVCMTEDLITSKKNIDTKKVKNYTTGNLCRCTGYKGIIKAGVSIDLQKIKPLYERYLTQEIEEDFKKVYEEEVFLKDNQNEIYLPKSVKKTAKLKKNGFKIVSSGTDISVLINKGLIKNTKIVSLINIESLYKFEENENFIEVGARVSLSEVQKRFKKSFNIFSEALNVFASLQIKNKGTLVGNVANGSPIGDTIGLLYVSNASLEISSVNDKREVLVQDFYLGYKQFDLKDDEIITGIKIPKTQKKFKFYKVSARKDLDISAVSLSISYELDYNFIKNISIAYGGVDATVYKAVKLEKFLENKEFSQKNFCEVIKIIPSLLSPFSDHRGSSTFRTKLCQNLLLKFYNEIKLESEVF